MKVTSVQQIDILRGINLSAFDFNVVTNIVEGDVFVSFLMDPVPSEGWKIHISATLGNYPAVLQKVIAVLLDARCSFKVMKSIDAYKNNMMKYGDRLSKGKLVTAYPKDCDAFIDVLFQLYEEISQYDGPYIITDRRFKDAKCLYYRYGSNVLSEIYDQRGNTLRIVHDCQGNLVVDGVKPYFDLPAGIEVPFDDEGDPSRSSALLANYDVVSSLKFTPMGGVYEGKRKKDGQAVIIKEAYPFTGMVNEHDDAVSLRKREEDNLAALSKFNFVPKVIEGFSDWENYYLVLEKVPGETLDSWVGRNAPFFSYTEPAKVKAYISAYLDIMDELVYKLMLLGAEGYILTDLAPDNIFLSDGRVYLLDLEGLRGDKENGLFFYTNGFGKEDNTPSENEIYAISSLLLYGFSREHELFDSLSPKELTQPILLRYPGVTSIMDTVLEIREASSLEEVAGILSAARAESTCVNYERMKVKAPSTLLPYADIVRKCSEGLKSSLTPFQDVQSLGSGFGGLLAAKSYLGLDITEEEIKKHISDYKCRSGSFFYGASGELFLRTRLKESSEDLLGYLETYFANSMDASLETGLSGYGVSLAYAWLNGTDSCADNKINEIAKKLSTIQIEDSGLARGKVGVALFFIYAYSIIHDQYLLQRAESLLSEGLAKMRIEYNSLSSMETSADIRSPYLLDGSFGTILVTMELMRKNTSGGYEEEEKSILDFLSAFIGFYSSSPSFIYGSAGILYTYLAAYDLFKKDFLLEGAGMIASDLVCRFKGDHFYHSHVPESYKYDYLNGDLGTACVLNLYTSRKVMPLFPFLDRRVDHA